MADACANPKCSCSPCVCGDTCKCGGGAKLGSLERQVMEILWAADGRELTGRDVAGTMPLYATTTVVTVLNRLSRKGAVRRRIEEHTAHFAAVDTGTGRAAAAMREALEEAGSDPGPALGRFVRAITPDEATTLRQALDRR